MPRLPILILAVLAAAPAIAQDAPPSPPPAQGGNETRADVEARAAAVHAKLDLNHDGFVTMDEMMAYAAQRMHAPGGKLPAVPPMLKAMLDDADTNHDGKISLDEAKAAALRGFDEADTNHDGIVTPDERAAAQARVKDDMQPRSAVGR